MGSMWNRREMLQGTAMLAAGIATRTGRAGMLAGARQPQVRTALGSVAGMEAGGLRVFKGIPFGRAPVGPLRFRAPEPAKPWSGVLDATHFASSAFQAGHANVSEDCLYLNIDAPAKVREPLPVFVWIHGGGFTGGSPVDVNGSVFARDGVITVTVPYRLGVFGFLDWSPLLGPDYADSANNGLRDLILALRWIHANIADFGGDPGRITIGGQSAGAKLTALLMAVDEARPLFSGMVSESGGGERIADTDTAHRLTETLAAQLPERSRDAILAAAPEQLLEAQEKMTRAWPANYPLRVQGGGQLLPHRGIPAIAAGGSRGKRLLLGTCRDEDAFALRNHGDVPITQKRLGNCTVAEFEPVRAKYTEVYPDMPQGQRNIRALTAEEYWAPSIRVAEAHLRGGGGATYVYRMDEAAATEPNKGEAYHAYDLGYVFENLRTGEPPEAQALSRRMHDAWVAFLQGKAPAADGLPVWPQWDPRQRPTMLFNATSTVEQQPAEAELRLWDRFPFE